MNNKILFIWQGDYPWDVRIEKQANSLKKQEYEVGICCKNTRNEQTYEEMNNIHIYRFLNIFKNKYLQDICSIAVYINPFWFLHVLNTIIKFKPDLIIVRDIPLFLSTFFIAKIFRIKVILDMAETFPAVMKTNKKYINNWFWNLMICKLGWYDYIEKRSVQLADRVIVVVEEQLERLTSKYNVNPKKFVIVSNTPVLSILNNTVINNTNISDKKLSIVYTGNFEGSFRGIQTLIDTAILLKDKEGIEFNVVGDGLCFEHYQGMIESQKLNNIHLLGRMPHKDMLEFIKTQDIGIVPHTKSDIVEYTIPNKIFDYMAYSLPIIVSSARPLQRIVKECDCGYIFEAEDASSLANLILEIQNKKEELNIKGANGFKAIKEKYNWENDEKNLFALIQSLEDANA